VTVTGLKFVSTAQEDKYGPGDIDIPQIGTIGAGLIWPLLSHDYSYGGGLIYSMPVSAAT
jgi:hypothetical protein